MFSNSFYEANITLVLEADKGNFKKERKKLQANISNKHRHKNPQQYISKWSSTIQQKDHTP